MKYFALSVLALGMIACQGPDAATDSNSALNKDLDKAAIEDDIRRILKRQDAAWNDGDIESFMASYWRSSDLRFASGGSIERGWQPTLERYLSRYPSRAAMGQLAFTNIEVEVIDADDALVFGHWALQREADRPRGLFTLHFKQIDGAWVIVSDHTSSAQ
jgi:hypothetical protein